MAKKRENHVMSRLFLKSHRQQTMYLSATLGSDAKVRGPNRRNFATLLGLQDHYSEVVQREAAVTKCIKRAYAIGTKKG